MNPLLPLFVSFALMASASAAKGAYSYLMEQDQIIERASSSRQQGERVNNNENRLSGNQVADWNAQQYVRWLDGHPVNSDTPPAKIKPFDFDARLRSVVSDGSDRPQAASMLMSLSGSDGRGTPKAPDGTFNRKRRPKRTTPRPKEPVRRAETPEGVAGYTPEASSSRYEKRRTTPRPKQPLNGPAVGLSWGVIARRSEIGDIVARIQGESSDDRGAEAAGADANDNNRQKST